MPPVHAPILEGERAHPRFSEYQHYRSAMSCQLVYCQAFASWLREVEQRERGSVTIFQAGPLANPAVLVPGAWYISHNRPGGRSHRYFGPYESEAVAHEQSIGMAGAFLLGVMGGLAWNASWAFGAGFHAGRMETARELTEVLTADDCRLGGAA